MKNVLIKALSIGAMSFATINSFAINWFVKSNGNGFGNSWENATSIFEACSQANDGDIIYIAAGDYNINKSITINKAITIIGGFNGTEKDLKKPNVLKNKVIFNGNANRCFVINNRTGNNNVTSISGITLNNFAPKGKDHGGAIMINYSTSDIILDNLSFNNCSVLNQYPDNPNIGANGGAIYFNSFNESVKYTIKNCNFTSCSSREGGAVYFNNGNAELGKEINIENCSFKNNISSANGGALYSRMGNNVKIEKSLFDSNTASTEDLKGSGGAIYMHMNNTINVKYSTFINNSATQKGSVIYGNGNKAETQNIVTFENSVLVKNNAKRTNTGRFAIDADDIGTNNIYIIKNSIVANNINSKNNIADMIIIKPSNKDIIENSILNCEYYSKVTAEGLKSGGKYKSYLTEEQITELLKGRGVKDPSQFKK